MATITTRSGKGSPLTNNEVDANFTNLNTDKAELSGAAFTGAITTNSTIDGRDVATDGTKLDGIESGATADQTAAQIKTAYESNSDTNAFTDADHSKLDGIEASADVTDTTNVTAAGALMDSELTSIASVKALNQGVATTDSPTFAALTSTGEITANGGIALGDSDKATFGAGDDLQIYHDGSNSFISEGGTGFLKVLTSNFAVQNAAGNESIINADQNGAVTLYYDNAAKLATTSTGIDVTGTATMDAATIQTATNEEDALLIKQSDGTDVGSLRINNGSFLLKGKSASQPVQIQSHDGNEDIEIDPDGFIKMETAGEERLRIDSQGRVGIGISNPSDYYANFNDLVLGNTSGHSGMTIASGTTHEGTIAFADGTSGNAEYEGYIQYDHADNTFTFGTDHTSRMTINSSGSVGIGCSPSAQLEVQDANGVSLKFGDLASYPNSVVPCFIGTATSALAGVNGDLVLCPRTSDAGKILFATGSGQATERMRIDASGNVGIGVSPSAKLSLPAQASGDSGVARFAIESAVDSNDFTIAQYEDGNGTYTQIGQNISLTSGGNVDVLDSSHRTAGITFDGRNNGSLMFQTGAANANAERMRIDSSGNVGIASTPSAWHSSFKALQIGATASIYGRTGTTEQIGIQSNLFFDNSGASGWKYLVAGEGSVYQQYDGNHIWLNAPTGAAGAEATPVERMRIDASGNVGIGTSTSVSASKLTVSGATMVLHDSSGPVLRFQKTLGTNTAFIANRSYGFHDGNGLAVATTDSNPIRFATNDTERMRIDSSGNVLVGVSSTTIPGVGNTTAGVSIRGDDGSFFSRALGSGDANNVVSVNRTTADGNILGFQKDGTTVGSIGTAGGDITIGTGDTGITFEDTANVIHPVTQSSGAARDNAIDLGKSAARFKDLYLSGKIAKGTGGELDLRSDGGGFAYKQNLDVATAGCTFTGQSNRGDLANIRLYQTATGADGGYIRFDTSNSGSTTPTEKMRIGSNGDLYWATTQAISATRSGIVFQNTVHPHIEIAGAADATSHHRITFWNSNGLVGSVITNGSATSYNTSSDYRLKENVVPMTGSIDRVKALKPSQFNFIADANKTVDGFLAHEAQVVVPECVTGTKDAMKDEEYEVTAAVPEVRDEDDNITTEAVEAVMGTRSVPDMQGIDQSKLVPLLTAALQEAITQIELLTARIEALEA